MDPQFRTSFIPKKPIVAAPSGSSSPINLFSLLSIILFLGAIALSAGVFFYKGVLDKQIETNKATFERAKNAFEPELVNQIVRLDSRIETAKKLLASHVAVTPLFDYLGSITLRSVRFKDFSFNQAASDKILVTMKGLAQSYSSVALQSDVFSAQKSFRDTLLSDMSLEPSGTVSFSVSTSVDTSLVSYAKSKATAAPATETASTTAQ